MAMAESDICITHVARTPIGVFQGLLASLSATELGSAAIKEIITKSGIEPGAIDEAFIGNVLSANLGQAPARQACLNAGLPASLPCTTVNKVCASGLKSVMLGAQSIVTGNNRVVLAGGMESMSNAPFYLPKMRTGQKMGHTSCIDGLIKDGLWDPYNDKHMGCCAEDCAQEHEISRTQQDDYALQSFERAAYALDKGYSSWEIVPVIVWDPKTKQKITVSVDEGISKLNKDKLRKLKPVFTEEGTVTAGTSSQVQQAISDGAAMVLLMNRSTAKKHNIKVLATIVETADAAQSPIKFPTTPSLAIKKLFLKLQNRSDTPSLSEIDIVEINEAFASVVLANEKLLNLDPERVNVYGGAIAIGHPLGCSGTRILITLINALRVNQKKYGIAAICNGGGGASAVLIRNEQI